MALISTTIPNLVNGVSQQPYALRLSSQGEAQVNGLSSVVDGLKKRPPTQIAARLQTGALADAYLHLINRDSTERYVVVITNGDLKVYDLLGNQQTVNFPDGKAYLNGVSPSDTFRAVTVADYTFILNTSVTAAMTGDLTPVRPKDALVYFKAGGYQRTYRVRIDGTVRAQYETEDGSDADEARTTDTVYIATQIFNGLTGAGGLGAGWTVNRYGNVIHIVKASGDFRIAVEDGQNGSGASAIKGTVQRFTDLANDGPHGFQVEVAGDQGANLDNYYVQFTTNSGSVNDTGVWKETVAQGIPYRINAATMPHALVREADGTFTFKRLTWDDRKVGDEDSAPVPSFIGKRIKDIFFYRNRLGFLADENVIFSRASEFYNFFPSTVTQQLDTDPIDVAVSHVKVSILQHAIPFNEQLLLFSDQTQFVVRSSDLLTPQTISINQTTEFECSLRAKPVGAGKNVYFAVDKGSWAGMREYYADTDAQVFDAAEITAHVPKYIPSGVFKIAAATNEDTLAVLTDSDRSAVYVYRYYWGQQEKLQSSWSKWDLGPDAQILNIEAIESRLYLIIQRDDGVYLEFINIEAGAADQDMPYLIHLDRRRTEAGTTITYNAGTNLSTITTTFPIGGEVRAVIRQGNTAMGLPTGYVLRLTQTGPTTFTVEGDLRGGKFVIGRAYLFAYKFSTLTLKEEAVGGGQQPVGEGRLQLRYMTLTYNNTGYFKVKVTPSYRDTRTTTFTGRIVGAGSNTIGTYALETGQFRFPLMSRNLGLDIEIESDSHLPLAFMSAEWEGDYTMRSRRL